MDSLKGFVMRAVCCVLVFAVWLVAGCTPSRMSTADTSASSRQQHAATPEVMRVDNDMPQSDNDEESVVARSISTAESKRADTIVQIVCDIVTNQVGMHEFPRLWGEKSRESQLAREYERMTGGGFDHRLERECPAYAGLHSKNR